MKATERHGAGCATKKTSKPIEVDSEGCILVLDAGAHGNTVGTQFALADNVFAVVLKRRRRRIVEEGRQPILHARERDVMLAENV